MQKKQKQRQLTHSLVNFYQGSSLGKMVNFLNESVLVLNSDGVIEMANPGAAVILEYERDALLGMHLTELLHNPFHETMMRFNALFKPAMENAVNHTPLELVLENSAKMPVSVEITLSRLPAELAGRDELFLCIVRDLTLHKAKYSKLLHQANTDFLTGLANRHRFAEYLSDQWQACQAQNTPLSILFIDIDHFKHYNDSYGHIEGDKCIQQIGNTIGLTVNTREALAARYGGEEFALVLPNHSAQSAQLLAIRIKRQIAQLSQNNSPDNACMPLTVSIGVATQVNGRYSSTEALLSAADELLYQAKSQGRDQVCSV